MRYINVLASLLAVFVSLLSLWLAWSSNRTQERMLAATSWPYLRFGHGNLDPSTGQSVIAFAIGNGGSGPAVLHWVRLSPDGLLPTQIAGATGVPLPHGGERVLFQLPKHEDHAAIYEALNDARWDMRFDACYCSLIGDCWRIGGDAPPAPVDACPSPPEGVAGLIRARLPLAATV